MRDVTISLVLLVVLPAGALATGVKRRLAGQARFTDTLSLLSKLNQNPYALNQALPSAPISLSQAHSGAGAASGTSDATGLEAFSGLGGGQAATVGSDAAADAVSDSIKNLFNLPDQAAPSIASKAAAVKPKQAAKAARSSTPSVPKASPPHVVKQAQPPAPKHSVAPPVAKPRTATPVATPKKAVVPTVKVAQATKPKPASVPKVAKAIASLPKPTPAHVAKASAPKQVPAEMAKSPPKPKAKAKAAPAASQPKPVPAKKSSTLPAATAAAPTKKAPAPQKTAAKKIFSMVAKVVHAPTQKAQMPAVAKPQTPVAAKPVVAKPEVPKAKAAPADTQKETAAMKSREAELEAEVSELKAKIAKEASAPKAKPAPAEVTPAVPIKQHTVQPVVAPKPPRTESPALPQHAPTPPTKSTGLAHVNTAVSKEVVSTAETRSEVEDSSDDFDGDYEGFSLASPSTKLLPPLYRAEAPAVTEAPAVMKKAEAAQVAPVVVASQKAPVVTEPAPTTVPAQAAQAEPMAMTMVPESAEVTVAPQVSVANPGQPISFFTSVGHWFHNFFLGPDPPAPPVPTQAPAPDPNAGRPPFSKQDIEHTALSAKEDGLSDVAIEDDFANKVAEDESHIDRIKREDRALRLEAETPKKPSMPAPANFQHDSGSTHISNFWGTLADEDADIERALAQDGDDLSEYERLRKLQDAKVVASVSEITGPLGSHLAIERRALRASSAN